MPKFNYDNAAGKIEPAKPLPEGDYLARITSAENSVSKSGNSMIVLELTVDGLKWPVRDWLVFTDGGARKINAAVKSCGLNRKLAMNDGECEIDASDFDGETGKVHLKVETYNDRERNAVAYWLDNWRDENGRPVADENDDVPF